MCLFLLSCVAEETHDSKKKKKKKVDVKCWSTEGMQRCLMILHPVCKTDAGKVLYTPMTVDVNAIGEK